MNRSASFQMTMLVGILVALTFMLVYLFGIGTLFSDRDIVSAEQSCSLFFNQVALGNFFEGNSEFSQAFWDASDELCSSFSTSVEEDQGYKTAEFLERCWNMFGGSKDVLPLLSDDQGLCLYCGSLELDGVSSQRFIEDMQEAFETGQYDSLFEDTSENVENLNIVLKEGDINFDSQNKLGVIGYSYRGDFTFFENRVSSVLSSGLSFTRTDFLFSLIGNSPTAAVKGVSFVEIDENGVYIDGNSLDDTLQCETVVPANSFEY